MADRRVKVVLEAEVANFQKGMQSAAKATEALKQKTEEAGKSTDDRAKKIALVAEADQKAAKAAGLAYNAAGQLVDSNNKVMSSSQAAAHGVQAFSEAVYLAGYESEQAAAKQTAAAEEVAAAQKAAAEEAAAALKTQQDAWAELGPVIAGAGAITVAAVGKSVATYASFDKAMSSVQASTHASAAEMAAYREAAIAAGADTAYSAEEAAGAIDELAKAGVSSADVLSGGLDGALSLAAAGSLEVSAAAEIAASALTQFQLSGAELPHVADLLAAGAGKAQGSVHDMGEALNQVGLVAAQAGLTIEETTGGLAAFASAGLTGSDAGTSFKTMLAAITPNSDAAAKAMEELGISAFDSSGQFIGLSEYAGVLQESMSGLTDEQRIATMETIFGSDAVRAASVMYEQGADGVQKWEDAVNDAGYAAESAAALQNNLAGDMEKLSGSIDTVFLKSGSGANDVLRGMVQGVEGVVDVVGKIPTPILSVGTIMAGVAGGAALLGGGIISMLPKVRDTRDALRDLAPAGTRAGRALDRVGSGMKSIAKGGAVAGTIMAFGVGLAKIAESSYMDDIPTGTGRIADALTRIAEGGPGAEAALDGLFKDRDGGGLTTEIGDLDSAIEYLFTDDPGQKFNLLGQDVVNTLTGIKGGKQIAEEVFQGIDGEIAGLVNSGNLDEAKSAFDEVRTRLEASGVGAEQAAALFPQYSDALSRASAESSGAAAGGDAVAGALEEVGVSADGAVADMEKFLDVLFRSGMVTMDSRDAAFAYQEQVRSIADAQEEIAKGEMGAALNKTKDDFNETTEAGKLANDEFQALAKGGMAEVEAMSKEGAGQDELQGKLSQTYKDLITAGEGFGLSKEAAQNLAREVLGVPDGVKISSWMSDQALRTAEQTNGALDRLDGRRVVSTSVLNEITRRWTEGNKGGSATSLEAKAYGQGRVAQGGRVMRRYSNGGRLPETGLGTDKILGMDAFGNPTAWVDDREWVINRESSDDHDTLLGMINRKDPRVGMVEGLLGLASGGRVGWAKDQRDKAKSELTAAKRAVSYAKKTKGESDDKAAEKRLTRAEKAYEAAQERYSELRESTSDLKTDLRRGNIRDAFTSGSGMSVVDRMFDAAADPNLSDKQRSKMLALAKSTEKQLLRLEDQSERVAAKLEKATAARDELLAVKNAVKGSMVGTFDLTSLTGQTDAWGYSKSVSKGSLLSYGKQKAASAKKLSEKVGILQGKGFAPELIQMVIDEWVGSGTFEVAEALLDMSKAETKSLNASFASVEKYAGKTGDYLTNAMAKGGLNAAQTLVNTLSKEEKSVEKAFYGLGKAGEKGFKRAWGIASPSKVAKSLMGWIGKGGVDGLKEQEPAMAKAAAELLAIPATTALQAPKLSPAYTATASAAQGIDYDRLAQAMARVQIVSPVTVDKRTAGRLVQVGSQFSNTH